MSILFHTPGQQVTIVQQILNSDGYREDGYIGSQAGPSGEPVITRIILPSLTLSSGYPVVMSKIDTGFYNYSFILPSGASAVGTYLIDILWYHPTTYNLQQDIIQIVVTAPYGLYSSTVGT